MNNIISLIGINASGKTTVLMVISFVLNLLNNEPINNIRTKKILNGIENDETITIESFFYSEPNNMCKLKTVIGLNTLAKNEEKKFKIVEEKLWVKSTDTIKIKKTLFEFDEHPMHERNHQEEFLLDDVSIMVAVNKKNNNYFYVRDMTQWTNFNLLHLEQNFPSELITFLDPSIEYIRFDKKGKEKAIQLKFWEREEIEIQSTIELNGYLSSGTIKGINVFLNAMSVFQNGGYLIIDELENHFNQEIVSTLIRLFMNSDINKKGGTLVFSTHYSELLDEFERNDNIYITRNRNGISAEKLSHILKRNDIKKSEAYQSDFLQGTVPAYESYISFKKAILSGRLEKV